MTGKFSWRAAATALVMATFLSGRQIASWGTPRNRWDYFWQRQDALALIVAVLLLTILVFGVGTLLSRWRWSRERRLHEIALVVGLIASLLSQFPALNKNPSVPRATLLWLGVALVVWLVWRRWPVKLPAAARGACLMMLPLVPILFGQMLLWRPWDTTEFSVPRAPPADSGSRRPFVVMIIFDEWSWSRTAPEGRPLADLPNMARLAEHSVMVRQARSDGFATRYAIPRFVFQDSGEVVPGNGAAVWKDGSGERPTTTVPSIFDDLHRLSYRTSVIGFYINYRGLVGPDQPNRVWSLPYAYKRTTWTSEVGLMLMRNLQHWTDPLSQAVWPVLSSEVYSRSWVYLLHTMEQGALQAVATEPKNTFLLIHLPLPHAPFVFERDGSFRGPYKGERMSDDSAGYTRHLHYTDRVLGEILQTLDSTGRFDHTLLIATSDHSWRKDPDSVTARLPDAGIHVPLFVKWPGQTRPLVSDSTFCHLGLWPVIQAAIAPSSPPPMTDSLWQAISADGRRRRCTR